MTAFPAIIRAGDAGNRAVERLFTNIVGLTAVTAAVALWVVVIREAARLAGVT